MRPLTDTELDAFGRDNYLVADLWTPDDAEEPVRIIAKFPRDRYAEAMQELADDGWGVEGKEIRLYGWAGTGWRHSSIVWPNEGDEQFDYPSPEGVAEKMDNNHSLNPHPEDPDDGW